MELVIQAPAKVNLHLKVLGRRADGMHELATVMQPVSVGDLLYIALGGRGLRFTCTDPALASGNLAKRAARLWYEAAGKKPSASVHLDKRLPVAAGLGGGSSDAAAVLLGLNTLHGGLLSPLDMVEAAAALGADVPFFLDGGAALCTGVGGKVEPWPDFPLLDYVLVNPRVEVSTAWVYGQWDLTWTDSPKASNIFRLPTGSGPLDAILFNDLEAVTKRAYPELGGIMRALRAEGALGALMSGSGPTVFGVFAGRAQASKAAERLGRNLEWWVRSCRGVQANARQGEGQHGGDRGPSLHG